MENKAYPYSDEELAFDEESGHYVPTEKLLLNGGVDIRARIGGNRSVDATTVIANVCLLVSDMIYAFVHNHAMNNARQDKMLAEIPSARPLLKKAMKYQALHVWRYGDMTGSPKRDEREAAICGETKYALGTVLPEIGRSILYTGV